MKGDIMGMAEQMKFCRECGKQISARAVFCPYCGTSLGQTAPKKQITPQSEQRKRPWIAAVASFIAVVLLGTGIMVYVGCTRLPGAKDGTQEDSEFSGNSPYFPTELTKEQESRRHFYGK